MNTEQRLLHVANQRKDEIDRLTEEVVELTSDLLEAEAAVDVLMKGNKQLTKEKEDVSEEKELWRKLAGERGAENKQLKAERDRLRGSDISQGSGDLKVVRVDGDPTGRTMPDSITIRSECATVTYKAINK